ncbi:DNA/RNA helicase [Rathayibacter sp. YIM 133350]|uniref:endonuclease domain-containing protein n=1 Tax=Rathayibacter sp. YIM 133350 TaxID=3131992 RepID=UPI00307D847D
MPMDAALVVTSLGKIAHRTRLWEAGLTSYQVKKAVSEGRLRRVRRDWFSVPECPPALIRAVLAGGRLTCLSAARHWELWMIDDGHFHVAVPPTAGRTRQGETDGTMTLHWARPIVATTARVAIDSIETVLIRVSECQPHENAVAVVDSALNKKLVRRGQLLQLASVVGGRFAEVVADSDGRADSGLETLPRVRLRRRGIEMVPQVRIDGHDVDGLIGECLALQFDGDAFHSTPAQRHRDREEDARLELQGYHVLRYGTRDVLDRWPRAEAQILSAMAQRLHLWPADRPAPLRPALQEIVRITGRHRQS